MSNKARFLALTASLLAVVALSACGGDDDDSDAVTGDAPTESAAEADADVTIETFQFQPNPAEAPAGTITVTNLDDTTHTFTSGTPDTPDDAFETLELKGPDATDTVELEPGTYEFFCEIHTSMTGSITVT